MNKKVRIASIGDCCIDIYPQYKKHFLGGTAFNVALQGIFAGAETSIFSAIGTDAFAQAYQNECRKNVIDISHIKIINGETSSVDIQFATKNNPEYTNWKLGPLSKYMLDDSDKKALQTYDTARVVLLKPMAKLFEQFCDMQLPQTLKVADFAGSSLYSEGITIIKKYIERIDIVIKSIDKEKAAERDFLKKLASEYPNKIILALLGKDGSMSFKEGQIYKQPALPTTIKDTNGAGDAYTAYFLTTYILTKNIPEAMRAGTLAATNVVTHWGANDLPQSNE